MAISLGWGIGTMALVFSEVIVNIYFHLSLNAIIGNAVLNTLVIIGIISTLPALCASSLIGIPLLWIFGKNESISFILLYISYPLIHLIIFWYIGNLSGRIAVTIKKLYDGEFKASKN